MVKKVFVRAPYNYDTDVVSLESGVFNKEPSKTQRQFKDEADINTIVKRFGVTGQLPTVPFPPTFGDFEDVFDFQSAQNLIREATESFMKLPADTRKRFNHDPATFVEFCSNADNLPELRKLGLAPPAKADSSSGTTETTSTGST